MNSAVYVSIRVPTDPRRAFDAFTRDIAQWWQPSDLFRITPHGDGELEFEPGQGGRPAVKILMTSRNLPKEL